MGAQAAANSSLQGRQPAGSSRLFGAYQAAIILLGLGTAALALLDLPEQLMGLAFFGLLAAAAQLADVELFDNSRSRISVSNALAIASILLFGPLSGALTHLFSGLTAAVTSSLRSRNSPPGRASLARRSAFNIAMLVLSTGLAGGCYVLLGGSVGQVGRWSNLLPLVAAVLVDTLANLLILMGLIALQTRRPVIEIWRQDFSWGAPINVLSGLLGGALALAFEMQGVPGVAFFVLPILSISYAARMYVKNSQVYVNALEITRQEQADLIDDLLGMLSALIDAKDSFTYTHSKKVVDYSLALAGHMGLPASDLDLIRRAALIHDIGKVGLYDNDLGKKGRLTAEEFNRVKRHPVIGAEIIGRMRGLQALVPLVRHHHERWDGQGYPDGLKGEEIPRVVRILTLADALEAMLADRPYRPTMNLAQVKAEIQRCSGTQFDPHVVAAFLELAEYKDATFFVNSAALMDRSAFLSGVDVEATHDRYLKKSQLD